MGDPVLQLIGAVLVLLVPVGVRLAWPRTPRRSILLMGVAGALAALASGVTMAATTPTTDAPALVLRAALALAVTSVMSLLATQRLGIVAGGIVAVVWALVVFLPIASAVLDGVPSLAQLVLGAVDYGGVLATHIAVASATLVLTLLPVRHGQPEVTNGEVSWQPALAGAGLVIAGASAWLLGAEGVITDASGRTLANAVVGMLLACLTWVAVEKIALDRVSPRGVIAGAVVGWGALGAGVPYLSPVALAATAIIATARLWAPRRARSREG